MVDLVKKKDDIITLLFWINVGSSLILTLFFNKTLFLFFAFINILCLGSFIILTKKGEVFENMMKSGKVAKGLNNKLEKVYG